MSDTVRASRRTVVFASLAGALLASPSVASEVALVASGTGFVEFDGVIRSSTVTVFEHEDGSFDGRVEYRNHDNGHHRVIEVDCANLDVAGEISVHGLVVESHDPDEIGAHAYLTIEDHGERASDPPDRATRPHLTPEPLPAFLGCAPPAPPFVRSDVVRGNYSIWE